MRDVDVCGARFEWVSLVAGLDDSSFFFFCLFVCLFVCQMMNSLAPESAAAAPAEADGRSDDAKATLQPAPVAISIIIKVRCRRPAEEKKEISTRRTRLLARRPRKSSPIEVWPQWRRTTTCSPTTTMTSSSWRSRSPRKRTRQLWNWRRNNPRPRDGPRRFHRH